MKAYLCGLWNGSSLWLQWDDVAPDIGYRLRVRVVGEAWRQIGGPEPLRKAWMSLPMWGVHATEGHPGAEMEAQVAVDREVLEWVQCAEVTFARSRCRFEFLAGPRGLHYPAGTQFHGIVDGAAVHYELPEEIELAAGDREERELVATLLTGYCQLDQPGDFDYRPALGSVIRNIAPSVDDVTETGATTSLLRVQPRRVDATTPGGQPLKIAFGRRYF